MHDHALKIIRKTIYAVVATSTRSGSPWNSPVFAVYDNSLNFYWASGKDSAHSRNIRENAAVFLTIFDSSVPWGTGEGVFIEARAAEVADPVEIAKACQLRVDRVPEAKQLSDSFVGTMPRRIYKATPIRLWANQDGQIAGQFVDERIEVDLVALRKSLAA